MTNPKLANALNALATAIANITPPVLSMQSAPAPILHSFKSDQPFDLSTCAGSSAFTLASAHLDVTWDGSTATFPTFVIALHVCSSKACWDAPTPHGITINMPNILTDYHHNSMAHIEMAFVAHTTPCTIQNTYAMYMTLCHSLVGNIQVPIFQLVGNVPEHEARNTLFNLIIGFLTIVSLQLSMLAFCNIHKFDPSVHQLNIPTIHTKLAHMFLLVTTQDHGLSDNECIGCLLTIYRRIQQPEQ